MFKSKKPERPYLKVCTKCHGKGQLSHFNTAQEKVYGSCKKCCNGDSPNGGLGVTLKCLCQESSSSYEFLRVADLQYIKGIEREIVKALKDFQAQLGTESSAVCLLCDCGARYLIQDTSARRRIRGDSTHNVPDKEVNKEIAEELAARGIAKVLVPSPSVRRH
ncbi:hypothetical protein Vretimale_12637 [Volvox reticuliferus]|uniref:Uncharacterized protein n=1 Tax=Volvox reticuliferus TaxID=1737510 RepID=A0A8J4LT82_9CHLO|nr:hypothetical protein Vretifemale_198 [Volvox reticuliferus]GIM08615.1 hypothetical protein Vretimale_12637 [Volvox reticuliferus]